MQITDPIADLLTRIRNANAAKHESVSIPASNMKKAICQILLDEGYIVITLDYLGAPEAKGIGLDFSVQEIKKNIVKI